MSFFLNMRQEGEDKDLWSVFTCWKIRASIVLTLFFLFGTLLAQSGSSETWRNYTNASVVATVAFEGDYVWEGTWGGLIKRSLTDPHGDVTYFTRVDGLPHNVIAP